ncbi:flippase [Ferribacterium limneticum]|uniref:flippase n=1 Tax=Ferribacterium limneticum TaxID=76259 RepID=UPI001CFC2A82|nr:flippase [Ferribacterium limneticum]UCV18282.1 flippase [Ferribacterium limneticum]
MAMLRNAAWVMLGSGFPMLVGVGAFPLLINELGTERFGLLSIVWAIAGYFSLFDLGLGRTLTQMVSDHLGQEKGGVPVRLIWTALCLMLGLGVLGGLILLAVVPFVVPMLHLMPNLDAEARHAFCFLALSIPVVVVSSGLVGVLEAHLRFRDVARVRMFVGSLNFLLPVLLTQIWPSLPVLTAGIIGLRVLSLFFFWRLARKVEAALSSPCLPDSVWLRPLLSFAGWLSVSNVVSPLMMYFDRFAIGAVAGASAVAYYVPPFEVMSRLQILPQSLMTAVFPILTSSHQRKGEHGVHLLVFAGQMGFLLLLPPLAVIFLFPHELLSLWLGSEFAENSADMVRWMVVGWLVNVLARPSFNWMQSLGRADLPAKLHCVELPVFGLLLYFGIMLFGIEGAAAAWSCRCVIDSLLLNGLARRCSPQLGKAITRVHLTIFLILLGSLAFSQLTNFVGRLVLLSSLWLLAGFAGFFAIRYWRTQPQ